jgi:Ser/Thr protein kinase RdoA (MazF antagonist)
VKWFVWYDESMAEQYISRINFTGSVDSLFELIVDEFSLGVVESYEPIEVGYEDYNVKLITNKGSYLVKIFASERTNNECERYVSVIETILKRGVRHPKLIASSSLTYLYTSTEVNVRLIVMEWIEGGTYYDIKRNPTAGEIDLIAKEAVKVNGIQAALPFHYDDWALDNIAHEFKMIKEQLSVEEVIRISSVIKKVEAIDKDKLPQGLVHGDLIKTNILSATDGVIYLLDFSVANNTARINELAVLCCNVCFDETSSERSQVLYMQVVTSYCKYQPLTAYELDVLPRLVEAAHAMHIIGATKYEQAYGVSAENDYWKNLGRIGLNREIYPVYKP